MTQRQLAEWLAKGNGQFRYGFNNPKVYSYYEYYDDADNVMCDIQLIRRWNSDEWIEPTLEVYLEDCGKES